MSFKNWKLSKNIFELESTPQKVVLVNLDDTNHVFEIDGVAAQVFKTISSGKKIDLFVSKFSKQNKLAAGVVERKIDSILKSFSKRGIAVRGRV